MTEKKKVRLPALPKISHTELNNGASARLCRGGVEGLSDRCEVMVSGFKATVILSEMSFVSNLGEGQFGVVDKMRHDTSGIVFAVKKIRCSMDEKEQSRLLNDINISMKGSPCQHLVISYGAMFHGGDVWICMEVLDTSLDKFYTKLGVDAFIPETLLAYITYCIVTALEYLHIDLQVIHRDVKPSNILIDKIGRVKVCDFGISGYLINSLAKTNVGSQPYLAPERINPDLSNKEYGIKSDVWSLGLSVLEVAIKKFPYAKWKSLLNQLQDVVINESSPTLPEKSPYSRTMRRFLSRCLVKNVSDRVKYDELLKHKWLKSFHNEELFNTAKSSFSKYVMEVLSQRTSSSIK